MSYDIKELIYEALVENTTSQLRDDISGYNRTLESHPVYSQLEAVFIAIEDAMKDSEWDYMERGF